MRNFLFPLLFFCLLGILPLQAQDTNLTDDKGRKQGVWTDFYPNGQKRYEGTFKNDRCQGTFTYYDEQGHLKATNAFDKSGDKALNKTYAPNGTLIATGYYINQKKEGEWRFFAEENGTLIMVEEYQAGKAHGPSKVYYETGVLMTERQYDHGLLEGHAKTFYPSGALKEEGDYHQGEKTGLWKAYNEEGDVISEEKWGSL